jgi:hypothetical protein
MPTADGAGYRPGLVDLKSSGHNLRNLYRRWAQFMEADSWAALAGWRQPAAVHAAEGD